MTVTNATDHCILCHGELRHVGADFSGKQIYKCESCRYVCTPLSIAAEVAELYDNPEYFDAWGANLNFDYDRFDATAYGQVEEYLEFLSRHTVGKSLLDVGTGNGLLPRAALDRGYDVEGTDLSRHVVEHLPAKAGFPVHAGRLEEIEFNRKFDIVTLLHVLEHTDNPLTTIAKCKQLLRQKGYVVVVVPNYLSLDSRIKDLLSRAKLKKRPYKHLALGHHNWVFSLKALEILGRKCGLQTLHRETRQPAARSNGWQRVMGLAGLGTWCWIVYRMP